jgi:hypothetical protein
VLRALVSPLPLGASCSSPPTPRPPSPPGWSLWLVTWALAASRRISQQILSDVAGPQPHRLAFGVPCSAPPHSHSLPLRITHMNIYIRHIIFLLYIAIAVSAVADCAPSRSGGRGPGHAACAHAMHMCMEQLSALSHFKTQERKKEKKNLPPPLIWSRNLHLSRAGARWYVCTYDLTVRDC